MAKLSLIQKKKFFFICHITPDCLKVLRCQRLNSESGFDALEIEAFAPELNDTALTENLGRILKKLQYNKEPLTVCLPRNHATCRYLKVPTASEEEIANIVSLQASRYLPYPAEELVTAYQTIFSDKDGYSHVNLVIVHRDVISRYLKILKDLNIPASSIVLGSFGLTNFYNHSNPKDAPDAMVVDIDASSVEIAVIRERKLVFSRNFRLAGSSPDWKETFIAEVKKTLEAYLKEVAGERPQKIVILGESAPQQAALEALKKAAFLPVESLGYDKKIRIRGEILDRLGASSHTAFSLIGLGFKQVPESLNILPADLKEQLRRSRSGKERIRRAAAIAAIILIWFLASVKNADNQAKYLNRLKEELNKVSRQAKPLEDIERRFKILENRRSRRAASLDIIRELYRVMPASVSLNSLIYEEGGQLVLRGQAPELNAVFGLVSQLERSGVLKSFNIKVRFATKKKTQAGEVVDFEIICAKK
ncbi:MAG: hypothetical protein FJZ09_04275 [Candidatus Omnitrophica bacterium]|nr:hypothetical protein [Candidatus Omnitrophota bacterium]